MVIIVGWFVNLLKYLGFWSVMEQGARDRRGPVFAPYGEPGIFDRVTILIPEPKKGISPEELARRAPPPGGHIGRYYTMDGFYRGRASNPHSNPNQRPNESHRLTYNPLR